MLDVELVIETIRELASLLEISDRKADILTNMLKEANADFEGALAQVTRTERNFRAVFENAPEAIYIADPDTREILDCNPFTLTWLGYPRNEFVSKRVDDFVLADEKEIEQAILTAMEQGVVRASEWAYKKRDGKNVAAEVTSTFLEYEGKECLVSLVSDVTERKRAEAVMQKAHDELEERVRERTAELETANLELLHEVEERRRTEQALRHSEERYRTLVEGSFDGIFFHRRGRIAFVNSRLLQMLGYEDNDLIGEDHLKLYHSDCRSLIRERSAARLRGDPAPPQYEITLQRKDGSSIEAEVAVRRVSFAGEEGSQVCLRDITQRKLLEEQLRQAQRLEGVGRLAGGVAHDFNNLLTAIMGYSDVLLNWTTEEHPFYDKLLQIWRAAERAADLTQQLLAFSRKQVLEVRVLNLNNTITDFQKILRRIVGEDVEISTRFTPNIKKVRADPSQIDQILMNLAVNARDAMPSGGTLSIETSNVTLDEEYAQSHTEVQPGAYVMFSVADTGDGMDADTRTRIFDPFFTTKEKGKGTGLGLSTVYGIVKQHNGHINVYSEPGEGTIFRVYLPDAQEDVDEVAEALPAVRFPSQGNETVLVVEDDNAVRQLTSDFLETAGYTVLEAATPGDAIMISEEFRGRIHLLLTDVILPHMCGTELYNTLAPQRPDMRVLYVSGYSQNAIASHGVLKAGIHFLPKPFTVGALTNKVREVLDGPTQHALP